MSHESPCILSPFSPGYAYCYGYETAIRPLPCASSLYCFTTLSKRTYSHLRPGVAAEIQAASYNGSLQRIHETDVSILDRTLAVNVRGVWLGTKHAAAQFLSQPGHPVFGHSNPNPNPNPDPDTPSHAEHRGWIINLCSILGSAGSAGVTSYCASKGAVLQLTRAAALEYARDGIHVNCIQPGFTDTQMLENMYGRAEGGKQVVDHLLAALHPWGRTGRAEDIARVAVFLAGEGAGWVTGQGLVVDGGYLAQ